MKHLLLLMSAALVAGCTTQSGLRAIGERNSAGAPVGDYRIVNGAGATQAQGHYRDGKMDGKWVFFDSRQVKLAEITYNNGVSSGPYKTYFGSSAFPAAAGKLESEGRLQGGQVVGQHIAYGQDGRVFSDAAFESGAVRHTKAGTSEAATRTAAADTQFVQTLEGVARSAIR